MPGRYALLEDVVGIGQVMSELEIGISRKHLMSVSSRMLRAATYHAMCQAVIPIIRVVAVGFFVSCWACTILASISFSKGVARDVECGYGGYAFQVVAKSLPGFEPCLVDLSQ